MSTTDQDAAMTHELRLNGTWLMHGDATSMGVIFNNLNGKNFAPPQPAWRTQTLAGYLAYMEHICAVSFAGGLLELAEIGQPATEQYQFD